MGATAKRTIEIMNSWIGLSRSAGTHKPIVDLYNSQRPLPRNYQVKYSDAYCATTVSAAFLKQNDVAAIGGAECSCEYMISQAKKAGLWLEDGSVYPEPGWVIMYNWEKASQPNDGSADHVGVVVSVKGSNITVTEGNKSGGVVGQRTIPVGWGYIRGYIRPKYTPEVIRKTFSPNGQLTRAMAVTFLWRLCGSPSVSGDHPFHDVIEGNYCHIPVVWAYQNGYVSGTSEFKFSPNAYCTRAQFLQMMWKISGSPDVKPPEKEFVDVEEADYYYQAVNWAVSHGFTSGTSEELFSPDKVITRAQAMTMLWRAQGSPKPASTVKFEDVTTAAYYYDAVQWAISAGITAGT